MSAPEPGSSEWELEMKLATEILAASFPGLRIRTPLYSRWPVALRFTLGGPGGWLHEDEARILEIHRRAISIFEACFDPADTGFVILQREAPTGFAVDGSSGDDLVPGARIDLGAGRPFVAPLIGGWHELEPYLPPGALDDVTTHLGVNLQAAPDVQDEIVKPHTSDHMAGDVPYIEAALEVAPRSLDYGRLIAATANRETPAEPRVFSQLFFVNTTRPTVFNIGDDRAADVIFADVRHARAVTARFIDWLEDACVHPE